MEPSDPDAPAEERLRARPRPGDRPHDLMAGNHAGLPDRQLPLDDVKVGPADAAGRHFHEDLAGAGSRIGSFLGDQGPGRDRSRGVEPEGAHPERIGFVLAIES